MELNPSQKIAAIEALLFAAGDSVALDDLGRAVGLTPLELAKTLEDMHLRYHSIRHGYESHSRK